MKIITSHHVHKLCVRLGAILNDNNNLCVSINLFKIYRREIKHLETSLGGNAMKKVENHCCNIM